MYKRQGRGFNVSFSSRSFTSYRSCNSYSNGRNLSRCCSHLNIIVIVVHLAVGINEYCDNVLIRVVVQDVYSVLVVLTRTLGYFVSSLELAALNAFDLLGVYADYNVIIIEIAGVSLRINIAEVDAVSVKAGDSNCIGNGLYRLMSTRSPF